jgi:hypothetical protein
VGSDLQDVEVHGLGEGPAFSDEDDIAFLDCEGRGDVSRDVSVSLLVSVVFRDVVEVITTDNNSALHLGGNDDSLQDLASNGNVRSEGTLLVNIVRLNSLLGSFEAEPDVLVVSDTGAGLFCEQLFAVEEDVILLLESSLVLSNFEGTWISAICVENIKYFNLIKTILFTSASPLLLTTHTRSSKASNSLEINHWLASKNPCRHWLIGTIGSYGLFRFVRV